jgi:hypothetical protein
MTLTDMPCASRLESGRGCAELEENRIHAEYVRGSAKIPYWRSGGTSDPTTNRWP